MTAVWPDTCRRRHWHRSRLYYLDLSIVASRLSCGVSVTSTTVIKEVDNVDVVLNLNLDLDPNLHLILREGREGREGRALVFGLLR